LGLLQSKYSNPERSSNVLSSPATLRMGIDRSYDIAIPKPEINVYTLLKIVRV
jgi:hypothetical protein